MSGELVRRTRTTNREAIEALHQLFFICERLDIMAHDPPPDGFVKVTAIMWRDQISPLVAIIQAALAPDPEGE